MNKLLITIPEARKILGKEAKGMTDDDVANLINKYDEIATSIVKNNSILKSSDLI